MRLSKAGYGSVNEILGADASAVMMMLEFESFVSDYEVEFYELNKDSK